MKRSEQANPSRKYCALCQTHTTHGTDGHDAAVVRAGAEVEGS